MYYCLINMHVGHSEAAWNCESCGTVIPHGFIFQDFPKTSSDQSLSSFVLPLQYPLRLFAVKGVRNTAVKFWAHSFYCHGTFVLNGAFTIPRTGSFYEVVRFGLPTSEYPRCNSWCLQSDQLPKQGPYPGFSAFFSIKSDFGSSLTENLIHVIALPSLFL
jgi:hypothetical protein